MFSEEKMSYLVIFQISPKQRRLRKLRRENIFAVYFEFDVGSKKNQWKIFLQKIFINFTKRDFEGSEKYLKPEYIAEL